MTLIDFIKFIIMPIFVGVGVFILGLIASWIKNMSKDIGDIKIELARHSITSENNTKTTQEHKILLEEHSKLILEHDKELLLLLRKK